MPYQVLNGSKIPIKVYVDDLSEVESGALTQLRDTANLPWVQAVAAMPDVHWGNGATVGSVIVSHGAISPAVVGVDIGCGMCAVKTPYVFDDLGGDQGIRELRSAIEEVVPVGFSSNKTVSFLVKAVFESVGPRSARVGLISERLAVDLEQRALSQCGSLGGGNHFIEVCLDKKGAVWVVLHSGSRNIGKELAEFHIRKAKGLMGELVNKFGEMVIPSELAALVVGTPDYQDYIHDLFWAQRYAKANRDVMMERILTRLRFHVSREPEKVDSVRIDCHHNYVEDIDHNGLASLLTRKGAVSAKKGELGIIPGSMGARSFIVRGKGNPDSFCSCSHGAGRKMSRGQAKRTFTVEDLEAQTDGVECRKDSGVLDEIPGAYKDIQKVMDQQSDLVDIVEELKQVLCVKG